MKDAEIRRRPVEKRALVDQMCIRDRQPGAGEQRRGMRPGHRPSDPDDSEDDAVDDMHAAGPGMRDHPDEGAHRDDDELSLIHI